MALRLRQPGLDLFLQFIIVGTFVGIPFAPVIYTNYDYLSKIADRVGQADTLFVRTQNHDPASVQVQTEALERHFEDMGLRVSTVTTLPNERAEAKVSFDAVVALLLVMAILLALVGGLGLMGTMSINVLERTREIGVLRAIGAPNRGVALVFILEGITIGLLSWVLGSLLAIPMTQGLNRAVGGAIMGAPLTYSYSLPGRRMIFFVDDNMTCDLDAAKSFMRALIPMKIRWVSQTAIHVALDEEALDLMRRSGCQGVLVGLESLDPATLRTMNKGFNLMRGGAAAAIANLHRFGIRTYGTFVFGYDEDTPESIRETVRFAEAVAEIWQDPSRIQLEVGPRTTLATLARQQIRDKAVQVAVSSLGDTSEGEAEWTSLLTAVGQLWENGVAVPPRRFYEHQTRRRVPCASVSCCRCDSVCVSLLASLLAPCTA